LYKQVDDHHRHGAEAGVLCGFGMMHGWKVQDLQQQPQQLLLLLLNAASLVA
jgi:hypothetical protein